MKITINLSKIKGKNVSIDCEAVIVVGATKTDESEKDTTIEASGILLGSRGLIASGIGSFVDDEDAAYVLTEGLRLAVSDGKKRISCKEMKL